MQSIDDYRVLIVPGLNNSGADHWQSRWQQLHPHFERVEQAHWDVPDLAAWSDALERVMRRSTQKCLLVAHSFGCLAAVHCIGRDARHVAAALLVAPADPQRFGIAEELACASPRLQSMVIGSHDDPWMSRSRAIYWAEKWGSEFVDAGAVGHINAASGLEDWPFGLLQLQRLALAARALNSETKKKKGVDYMQRTLDH